MSTIDRNLPAQNSPGSSAEMRAQFGAAADDIDALENAVVNKQPLNAVLTSLAAGTPLPVGNGGTGASLAATGGAGRFLKQLTAGGAITVAAILASELPTTLSGITFTGGTFSGAAFNGSLGATTPSTAVVTTLTASGQTSLGGAAGSEGFRVLTVASAVDRVEAFGAVGGGFPTIRAAGASASVPLAIESKGASSIFFNANSATQVSITSVASTDRRITLAGSNGGQPSIGTSAGGLAFSPAGTVSASVITGGLVSVPNTAIPAGGTAGVGIQMSSTSQFGIFFGSGAPTLSAAKGSIYLRSDGSGTNDRMYVNTNGSTTWTAVVTVA